jgi:hypothetical protein
MRATVVLDQRASGDAGRLRADVSIGTVLSAVP